MMTNQTKKSVLTLVGPTGVGKTEVGMELTEKLGAEIVSADSRQIYSHMDVGTGKPTMAQREKTRHHLIDIINPDEVYNALRFKKDAEKAIEDITARGKIPIVVGGTGLYISALFDGIFECPEIRPEVKSEVREIISGKGLEHAYGLLKKIDEESYNRINANDAFRIARALEVYFSSGVTISEWRGKTEKGRYEPLFVGLAMDRQELYKRIELRVDRMLKDGIYDETRKLRDMGYDGKLYSMQSLGYKQMNEHLDGRILYETAVYEFKRDTRHYAKRQIAWFKRDGRIKWMDAREQDITSQIIGIC